MQKRYENELLGIHVHTNIPPAESWNSTSTKSTPFTNTLTFHAHYKTLYLPDFTRTGTPGTHTHTHTHTHTQPVSPNMSIRRFAHLCDI